MTAENIERWMDGRVEVSVQRQVCKMLSGWRHARHSSLCCLLMNFLCHIFIQSSKLYIPYFLQIGGLCLCICIGSIILFCEIYIPVFICVKV